MTSQTYCIMNTEQTNENIFTYTNTHHGLTDLVKNTKNLISYERIITFPQNKKHLNLCFILYNLRSFLEEI